MIVTCRLTHEIALVTVIGFLLLIQSAVARGEEEPMPDPQETKVHRFLDRIKTAQQAGSIADLRSLREDIEKAWRAKKDAGYVRVIRELCEALNSTGSVDSSRVELIRKLTTAALDIPENKPVDEEVKLLLFLQSDPDYTRGSLRGEAWRAERPIRVLRWLTVWRHLLEEEARWAKKVGGSVELNVQPPPETGFPGGVSPKAIKDPVLRKKYEESIARNAERARVNRKKSDLRDLESRFTRSAKRYIIAAYSKPPFQTDELEKLLGESGLDANVRTAILDEVKKRVVARTEHEAKQPPPPQMKITEPPLPPDAPTHHADPRLRVKVSFDLASPRVDDVLHELRQATKVDLSRADDIQNRHSASGSLSFRGVAAWQVMDILAKSKCVEGRWEKDGTGYRLVGNGNSVSIPEASKTSEDRPGKNPRRQMILLISTGVFSVLLVALLAVRWWRRGKQNPTA